MKGGSVIDNVFTMYHCHTDYSLLDSATQFQDYVELAVQNGQTAIASTEHGFPRGWVTKKKLCDAAGIKFIHGVEIYLTESLAEKVRDNYHTVLLAKNMDGFRELNALVSLSSDKEHFYYKNRLSFDEFLKISDNIITTSACLASPLNKLPEDNPYYMPLARKYTFLEIQPHNHPEQIAFNQKLKRLSQLLGKPLIAGTDTHNSSEYKSECRKMLILAKRAPKNGATVYEDEDSFDLSYKTYSELVDMFRIQGALSEADYIEAIQNTNRMADMVEPFDLDTAIKYPILYGSSEADEAKFIEVTEQMFHDKVASGIIPASEVDGFRTAIDEEMRVFQKLKMTGFMLSMHELLGWCKAQGMAIGTARGSVGGSRIAYVTDIIDLDPEQWHTVFSRFCNEDRVEIGDIDVDVVDSDKPAIIRHITEKFGSDKVARVAAYGTLKDKGVVDDVGRALARKFAAQHGPDVENPWSLPRIAKIKEEMDADFEKTKAKYPELFYYFDGLIGTKVSQSVHPAGVVISPITLNDNYGFFDKDGENCLMLDMDEAHDTGLAKYDFLSLKTVQVVRDTCNYIGIPYPKTYQINWDDQEVWSSITKNADMVFQFEGKFAADSLKKYAPKSIFDMSLVTAAIRPSGASYRDDLLSHKHHANPSELIDQLLSENNGFLVYQEDIIKFLQQVCGLSGSEADNVRRGIARKKPEVLEKAYLRILEGYCSKSDHPKEQAESEAKEFLKIIEDASSYMFGYNHSIAYCLLGYLCGYYRYYYPMEFITSYLNNAANDGDIAVGTAYANKIGVSITMPKWGVSKGEYFFDKEKRIIAKGLSSVKYMSPQLASGLYELAQHRHYTRFVDILQDISKSAICNSRQLEILIKIDFFSEFGNQRELLRIMDLYYQTFKCGEAKQIKKQLVDGTPLEPIIKKYAVGVTKSGGAAKSYTLLDICSILREAEDALKAIHIDDLSDLDKVRNFYDVMGYIGYVSGKQEDRPKLYVTDVFPVKRKSDGKQFGCTILTKSIGSGRESRFTVFNRLYNTDPIKKGDIIRCKSYNREGQYFTLTGYEKIF